MPEPRGGGNSRARDRTSAYLLAGMLMFLAGWLLLGWLASRLYCRHYATWRIDSLLPPGSQAKRLVTAVLVAPLTDRRPRMLRAGRLK